MREHIEIRILRNLVNHPLAALRSGKPLDLSSPSYISDLELEIKSTIDRDEFAYKYMLANLLKKWTGWDVSKNALIATQAVWLDCERHCFSTNWRFRAMDEPSLTPENPASNLILTVRRKISEMIGYWPPADWSEACDWPTGATGNTPRAMLVGEKVCKTISSSKNALPHGTRFLYQNDLVVMEENRMTYVPKSYKVLRPIACEPTLNAFLQKGVGRTLRRLLLRRKGVDIRFQADRNRENAFLALSCNLSTLDLESASDTIACSVVQMVFPEPWYDLFDSLRSSVSNENGKRRYLEKFASMGNGFIFELETVLFRGIALAVAEVFQTDNTAIEVFGDDIIVPESLYDATSQALTFFGFRINEDKSFKTGPFFESCGRHYYEESEVTPVYQKETVKSISGLVLFHNRLYRWAHRTGFLKDAREALSLIKNEAKALPLVKKYGLPRQPAFLAGDFGFISRNWGRFDKNGDILLNRSLSRKVKTSCLTTNHQFYLDNWLRCSNSFYADSKGQLQAEEGASVRIHKDKRMWMSGATDNPGVSHDKPV